MKSYKSKTIFPIGAIIAIVVFLAVLYLGLWNKIWGLGWCCGAGFVIALIYLFLSTYKSKTETVTVEEEEE